MDWDKLFRWLIYLSLIVGGGIVGFAVGFLVMYLFSCSVYGIILSLVPFRGNPFDSFFWEGIWGIGIMAGMAGLMVGIAIVLEPSRAFKIDKET